MAVATRYGYRDPFLQLVLGLGLCGLLSACPRASIPPPAETEPTSDGHGELAGSKDPEGGGQPLGEVAPELAIEVVTRADFEAAAKSGFSLNPDTGLVVVDTWDEELEQPKPRQATKLCGAQARATADSLGRAALGRLGEIECSADLCIHPAAEAIDYRGEYRFKKGQLEAVLLISGPPAHVMQEVIDAELAFAERAIEALADASCGETLAMD